MEEKVSRKAAQRQFVARVRGRERWEEKKLQFVPPTWGKILDGA